MREVVLPAVHATAPALTWNGWGVPMAVELLVLTAVGLATFAVAVKRFAKTD